MENVLGEVVKVHPVALFTIVDGYERRLELGKRVIGTLMGTKDKGVVEIKSCYAVPHNETDDEVHGICCMLRNWHWRDSFICLQVAVDMIFVREMSGLQGFVNKTETVVGW